MLGVISHSSSPFTFRSSCSLWSGHNFPAEMALEERKPWGISPSLAFPSPFVWLELRSRIPPTWRRMLLSIEWRQCHPFQRAPRQQTSPVCVARKKQCPFCIFLVERTTFNSMKMSHFCQTSTCPRKRGLNLSICLAKPLAKSVIRSRLEGIS